MHLTVFKIVAVKRDDLTYLPTLEPPPATSGHAFVYILACSDGALYVGSAGDLASGFDNMVDRRELSLRAIILAGASFTLKDRW